MDYFDCDYFDPDDFETDCDEVGGGRPPRAVIVRRAPDSEDDDLFALL